MGPAPTSSHGKWSTPRSGSIGKAGICTCATSGTTNFVCTTSNAKIARRQGVTIDTVRRWRDRYANAHAWSPRPGRASCTPAGTGALPVLPGPSRPRRLRMPPTGMPLTPQVFYEMNPGTSTFPPCRAKCPRTPRTGIN